MCGWDAGGDQLAGASRSWRWGPLWRALLESVSVWTVHMLYVHCGLKPQGRTKNSAIITKTMWWTRSPSTFTQTHMLSLDHDVTGQCHCGGGPIMLSILVGKQLVTKTSE